MSYILDALRRAEADRERERGQVPGLHTQALSGSEAAPAAGPRRWLPWAGAGLLLAGIGAGSWWASSPREAPSPGAPPASTPVPQPAPAPLATAAPPTEVATAPMTLPAATAPTAPGATQLSTQPTTQPAISVPMPQPAASASPYLPPAPPPGTVAPAPRPGSVAAAMPAPVLAAPPAPPPAPVAEARIPRLTELPESTRRELPKLAISGSVYSDNPASRFVIINGEVVREGAHLGGDLVLEQIGSRELVMRFKGQRFQQPV